MMLQTLPVSSAKSIAPAIPVSVLDNLAARFRPGGLCLLMLNPDGTLVYHDSAAGLFFQRFCVPMVQYPDVSAHLGDHVGRMTANSTVDVWNSLPGVVIAAFPYVEKRKLAGIMLLAAKGCTFRLGEEVL